ncbi:MAG: hypothetical protein EAX81_04815 [Candidatus Thorarchaeota archaeon]|nr:hypothetical protein [Candidatus Thorarchaeota archaeon]
MTEDNQMGTQEQSKPFRVLFRLEDITSSFWTILIGLIGAVLFMAFSTLSMPFLAISLFKFGILPTIVIIALVGAFRGPFSGFLAGYIGVAVGDLLLHSTIVSFTLQGIAYGLMGLVVGLSSYNFATGRSLAKLSILSLVGLVLTALLLVVVGIVVEGYSVLVGIGFVLLPMLTQGIPTVLLLVPVSARVIHAAELKALPTGS